ncbi:alpha/beta fold hydrolase [Bacteroidota bacterium]
MKNLLSITFILTLLLWGCEEDTTTTEEIIFEGITALPATNITANGFQINWRKVDKAESYEIEISTDIRFTSIVETYQINDLELESYVINDLEKDVQYYYHIRYYIGSETSDFSNAVSATTNYIAFTNISALSASNISQFGFQANWSKIITAEKYELEISTSSNFTEIVKTCEIVGADNNFLVIDDLEQDMKYYYRVRYYIREKCSDYSDEVSVITNYINTDFTLTTNGIVTKATLTYKLDHTEPAPAIIFIHMGSANRYEWTNNALYQMCIDSGYVALAYDLRGHGESEGTINWITFTSDPDLLPKDLDDVITYLQAKEFVNPNRIGIVGGSMGAILATGATQYPDVKVAVALTSFYDAVESLYGTTNINTVYYIAGENDNAYESQALFDVTLNPKKIDIILGSSSHSAALINTDERRKEVFNWIKAYI